MMYLFISLVQVVLGISIYPGDHGVLIISQPNSAQILGADDTILPTTTYQNASGMSIQQ